MNTSQNSGKTTIPGSSNVIENYAHHLESAIKHAPDLWLWSHRRWKKL
ncbi:MAG: hypothetical protein NTX61_02430 [Bacteroidetes bacterium]|nr:hypothetical protein [Bacteroidota bacterium]